MGDIQQDGSHNAIETVPKKLSLHVSRIKPGTTEKQMEAFVQQFFPEAMCELLDSRYPQQYTSFKVTLYSKNMEAALTPQKWPRGALVNKFFRKRVQM